MITEDGSSEPQDTVDLSDAGSSEPAPDAAGVSTAGEDSSGEDHSISVESLLTTLETVTAERDQHLADLQRVSAEFANFRKQTEKRNADFAAHAGSRVAEALLPVLDACEAAALQGVEGVEPIAGQLRGELERAGLQVIDEVEAAFDPNLHEAAMSEPGDDDQDGPLVAQILRTGYAWNGRVLRAAMVKVKG